MAASFGSRCQGRGWRAAQEADQPPLPARVVVHVTLGRLDRAVPGEQLHVAQAALAAMDVPSGVTISAAIVGALTQIADGHQ